MGKRYDLAIKEEVLKLRASGTRVIDLQAKFGLPSSTISTWCSKARFKPIFLDKNFNQIKIETDENEDLLKRAREEIVKSIEIQKSQEAKIIELRKMIDELKSSLLGKNEKINALESVIKLILEKK